ncbi:glutamate-rich WD repeat-containing protein 1, partial [Parus major]|uniref:glutamate-rich WD repeat-containing protein 1 n=1 Tax=Parus major TaxID=9157 RepID=UPI0007710689
QKITLGTRKIIKNHPGNTKNHPGNNKNHLGTPKITLETPKTFWDSPDNPGTPLKPPDSPWDPPKTPNLPSSPSQDPPKSLPHLPSPLSGVPNPGDPRIFRVPPQVTSLGGSPVAAVWSERGQVEVLELGRALRVLEGPSGEGDSRRGQRSVQQGALPELATFSGHLDEGFALDWSPQSPGRLLSGDVRGRIHRWEPREAGWAVDQRPLLGHGGSVEDIQWSPSEASVFISCSSDASIRVWDVRAPPPRACQLSVASAHDGDVNVVSW